jgi:predicted double-glycine peptidase
VSNIIVRQAGKEGCGLAALRTLLVNLSHDRNYRYLTLNGHPPYSLANLREAAKKEGLKLDFRRAVATSAIRTADRFPFLAVMKTPSGSDHMILVTSLSKKGVRVLDPTDGRKVITFAEFERTWTLIFGEVISYEKRKAPCHRPDITPLWPMAIEISIEILADVALLFGFYFMNGNGSFLYPVACFSAFGLGSVLRRYLATLFLKKFDKRWLLATYDADPNRFRLNYEHYHSYKRCLFASPFDCFSALFLLLAMSFLVGSNNPSFFVAFGAIGVYEGVAALLFSRHLRKRREALAEAEESLFSGCLPENETFLRLASLNKETYDIADRIGYFRIVFYAVCLALTFLCFLGQSLITLNFYLFHFFAILTSGDAFERAFGYLLSEPFREEEKEYFNEYFAKNNASE